jgi:hypothetical protein
LRSIRRLVSEAVARLNGLFNTIDAAMGQAFIAWRSTNKRSADRPLLKVNAPVSHTLSATAY